MMIIHDDNHHPFAACAPAQVFQCRHNEPWFAYKMISGSQSHMANSASVPGSFFLMAL